MYSLYIIFTAAQSDSSQDLENKGPAGKHLPPAFPPTKFEDECCLLLPIVTMGGGSDAEGSTRQ
jgi:hypothetical protein